MTRAGMWVLLVAVGVAAAILSFSALKDLAVLCGFHPYLAPLLPLVVDAGAGAGCLVWLGGHPGAGRRFARALTWTLLASSVAGNAVVHGLTAYGQAAPWWLVVAVSAIAPAVLGAVVHLAVLVGRAEVPTEPPVSLGVDPEPPTQVVAPAGVEPARSDPSGGEDRTPVPAHGALPTELRRQPDPTGALPAQVYQQVTIPDGDLERATPDLLAQLLDEGASRRRVAAMLGVSEYRAKKLLASRNGNGAHP